MATFCWEVKWTSLPCGGEHMCHGHSMCHFPIGMAMVKLYHYRMGKTSDVNVGL